MTQLLIDNQPAELPAPAAWTPVHARVPQCAMQVTREFEIVDADGQRQHGEAGDYVVRMVGDQLVAIPRMAFAVLFKSVIEGMPQ